MEMTVGDGIATVALLLSGFSLWRQRGFDEQEKRLNALLISREEAETMSSKRADIFADFVNPAKHSYRLNIYNRGKAPAQKIVLEVCEGEELFDERDLERRFPYPSLEPHQAIKVPASVHLGSPRRARILLRWEDAAGGGEKEITADVF